MPIPPARAILAPTRPLRLALLAVASSLLISSPASSQYVWIDTNGDGANTAADVLAPSGSTALDVWLRTDQDADGTPAVCSSGDGALTISGYSLVLRATNGTVAWGTVTNRMATFTATGSVSDGSELDFGYSGGALPPGPYRLATVEASVATGTPAISFGTLGALDNSFTTSFSSTCSGTDLDGSIKLGTDFTDASGIPYGGTANTPPLLAPPGDVTMSEGETRDVPVTATDADGDVVTLSIALGPAWASLLSAPGAGTASGTLHLAPGYEDAGDATIAVRASDGVAQDEKTLTVHVANTNRAPAITPIAAMNLAEGVVLDTPIRADDADGDACTFFVATGPLFITVSATSSAFGTTFGNLHAAPGFADAGTYDVIIGTRDPSGAADSTTYIILVREQDRPPVLTVPPPISGTEGEPVAFTVSATDADGDMVMFQPGVLPAGAQFTDQMNGSAVFAWTPGFDQAGSYTVAITADDMNGSTVNGSVTITVADVTDPVAIARPATMTVIEGDIQEEPLLGFSAAGSALTFEKVAGPDYVTVATTDPGSGTAHGTVHVAPGSADGGTTTVTVAVTDGTNRDETSFEIHVVDAASLPARTPFQPPFIHLGVGLVPHTVAVGDMNEDGVPDLLTANLGANTVTIYPALGGLAYGTRINLATAVRPHTVVARDLNHDGHLDLIVSHIGSSSFGVWLGNGDGTFGARHDFQLTGSPVYLGVYDYNEDGNPDVVATDQTHGGIGVALGVGDGTFATTTFVATGPNAHGLVGVDVNRDGHLDLAVSNSTTPGTVSVLLGKGDGTFQPKIDFGTSSPHTVTAGDLDQDGDADLVISNFDTGTIAIALGNGDGTFATQPEIPTGTNPHASAIGDVDGDGRADIVVANQGSNTLSMIMGKGGASWAPKGDYPVGLGPHNVAIADLDGDGRPEVSVSNIVANTVTILKNRGAATRAARVFVAGATAGGALLLRAGGPEFALHVEPSNGEFDANDVVLPSVELMSQGTGTVDHITANAAKGLVVGDADRNGVPEAIIPFTRDDLRALFASLQGRQRVEVTLQGSLADGASFSGETTLGVIGTGPPGKPIASASVSPNPLNPAGTLSFELASPEAVTIHVYDARGRLVRRLMERKAMGAGRYRIPFDGVTDQGGPLASGVYFFKIRTRDGDASGRFAVLR